MNFVRRSYLLQQEGRPKLTNKKPKKETVTSTELFIFVPFPASPTGWRLLNLALRPYNNGFYQIHDETKKQTTNYTNCTNFIRVHSCNSWF